MARATELLGSAIHEIKAVWTGPDNLQQANYALRTLPKGLKFLRVVPPLESPKVVVLMDMHDPDALCNLNGVIHCPWCRKEGQNEGTVINHLWTVHYRAWPHVWEMFWLPIHLIRDHLPPQLEGLPTLREGRPQWVILISITVSRRCMRSISSKWEPVWRTQGRFQHPLGFLIGDDPHPTGMALQKNQTEEALPTNPTYPITSVFPHTLIRWPLPSANPELHKVSTRDTEVYELKVKSQKITWKVRWPPIMLLSIQLENMF